MDEINKNDFIKTDKIYYYKQRALNRANDHIHYKIEWGNRKWDTNKNNKM